MPGQKYATERAGCSSIQYLCLNRLTLRTDWWHWRQALHNVKQHGILVLGCFHFVECLSLCLYVLPFYLVRFSKDRTNLFQRVVVQHVYCLGSGFWLIVCALWLLLHLFGFSLHLLKRHGDWSFLRWCRGMRYRRWSSVCSTGLNYLRRWCRG